jgi:fructose-1-phosphate kinase PfkB-like protein
MNYYEVDPLLKKLGKDRKWLAEATHYTLRSINVMLSPKGVKSRSAQAMARIEEALRMEEARQQMPIEIKPVQTLVLQPSLHEFEQWNKQALREKKLVTDWAVDALNAYAEGIILTAAEDEPLYKTKKSSI